MGIMEEHPALEYMIVGPVAKGDPALMLPGTLQAPHLHHLRLSASANYAISAEAS